MTTLKVSEIHLPPEAEKKLRRGGRIRIRPEGKGRSYFLIGLRDYAILRSVEKRIRDIEDSIDTKESERILEEMEESGEGWTPLEDVRAELGL